MKAKLIASTDVTETKDFRSLSFEAQVLYYRCCALCNTFGHVDAESICFGMRCDEDVLDELYEKGYLIDVDGMTFIRHQWVNNNYSGKEFMKMKHCTPYVSGTLRFEGEPGHSAYARTEERGGTEGVFDNVEETPDNDVENFHANSGANGHANGCGNTKKNNCKAPYGRAAAPSKTEEADKPKNGKDAYPIEKTDVCKGCYREGAVYRDWGTWKEIVCKYCGTLVYDEEEGVYKRQGNERGVLGALDEDQTKPKAKEGLFRVVNF